MARKLPIVGRTAKKGAKGYAALQLAERVVTPVRTRTSKTALILVGAGSAVAVYLLDPREGKRRRAVGRDRARAVLRRGKREAVRRADYAAGEARGAAHEAREKVKPDEPKPELTDQDLARKVETIVFRDADSPKGQVSVDAAGRTVTLRGQLDSREEIDKLVKQAEEIPEVERVESLLHLPGEAAPGSSEAGETASAGAKGRPSGG